MDTDSKLDWAMVEATVYTQEAINTFMQYCKAKYTDLAMAEVEAELKAAFYYGYNKGLAAGVQQNKDRVIYKVVYVEPGAKQTRIPPKQIHHN